MERDRRRSPDSCRRPSPDGRSMRRSRCRSPLDRRDRDRRRPASPPRRDRLDRDRPERDRSARGERSERDRDDRRHRSRSPAFRDHGSTTKKKERPLKPAKKIDLESCQGVNEEMQKMMGFGAFDTTKDKKVPGNAVGAARINKPRKYRQYMNRKGGFNRPLDYVA